MILSREQAVKEHRKMWLWIARESIKRKKCVSKRDYMSEIKGMKRGEIKADCFCCEYLRFADPYVNISCVDSCPIIFKDKNGNIACCLEEGTEYRDHEVYRDYNRYVRAAFAAYRISRLPERKV